MSYPFSKKRHGCQYFLKTCRAPALCVRPFFLLDSQHFVISSWHRVVWGTKPFVVFRQRVQAPGRSPCIIIRGCRNLVGPHWSPYFYQRPPASTPSENIKQIAQVAGKVPPPKKGYIAWTFLALPPMYFQAKLRSVLFIVRAGTNIIRADFMHTERSTFHTKMKIGIHLQ